LKPPLSTILFNSLTASAVFIPVFAEDKKYFGPKEIKFFCRERKQAVETVDGGMLGQKGECILFAFSNLRINGRLGFISVRYEDYG
jgi:hypothetical protein